MTKQSVMEWSDEISHVRPADLNNPFWERRLHYALTNQEDGTYRLELDGMFDFPSLAQAEEFVDYFHENFKALPDS